MTARIEPAGETPPLTAAPRPAASLVLLRDSPAGVQVYMLKRSGEDDVLAGAHVFPGGKVDREDAEDEALARLGASSQELHALLAEPELDAAQAAALFVAAIRETFEEAGVLFSAQADERLAERATALRREGCGFVEVLQTLDLRLDAQAVAPWSRWVTPQVPSMMRKRFDTRFFVGRMPGTQQPQPDPRESVGGDWVLPHELLRRYWQEEVAMAAPQIMTLAHLTQFDDVDAVMAEARRRAPPVIRPEPYEEGGVRFVTYPGDERHSVRERAMPGPTRLRVEGRRFRPPPGFDDWYAR